MTQVLTSAGKAEPLAADPERADPTIRRRDDVNGSHTAEQTSTVIEARSRFTSVGYEAYEEDRKARLFRGRLVGFSVCIPLWLLSVVPLARESMDGRAGADAVAVYLAVGAFSLGFAVVIRGAYVLLTKRHRALWTQWMFLAAALVAIVGYTVQSAGEQAPLAGASALESRAE
jgi:hypothetical protein